MPLAVSVRSLLEKLNPQRRVHLYLLDAGMKPATHARLRESWQGFPVEVTALRPDIARLTDLRISDHVTQTTYFRLLIPELVPQELNRVIYLDSDLLVRRDLSNLWEKPLDDAWCLAAPDCAAPVLDALETLPNARRCVEWLAAAHPIPNYRQLGLPGQQPYLNGGVLVINVAAWREERLTNRMLACLREHASSVLWWDQYALNVVLAGKWRAVDMRWNQGSQIYQYPDWQRSPLPQQQFNQLRSDPWIVHFNSPSKPWHAWNRHPFQKAFLDVLDRTAWRGTRPTLLDAVYKAPLVCWRNMLRRRHVLLTRRHYRKLMRRTARPQR